LIIISDFVSCSTATGEVMASEVRGKYLIVSTPDYQPDKESWLMYSFVMWGDDKGLHTHQFKSVNRTFRSEREAEAFGTTKARSWIERQT
jgi:hypothetical protein